MVTDTFRLFWTDTLVTLMLCVALIVHFLTGDKYTGMLSEARRMAAEWKEKRQALATSARRLAHRGGLGLFCLMFVSLVIMAPFAGTLRALVNTPAHPILLSELLMGWVLIGSLALGVALSNVEG